MVYMLEFQFVLCFCIGRKSSFISVWFQPGMKISDISVDISPIYPISVMFDTISAMTDISLIYRFWTDISWKHQVCGTCAR